MYTSTTYNTNAGYTRTTTTRSPTRVYTTTRSPARVYTNTYVPPVTSTYVSGHYSPLRTYSTLADPLVHSRVVTNTYSPARTYTTTVNEDYSPSRVVTTTVNNGLSPSRVITTHLNDYSPSRTYTTTALGSRYSPSRVHTTYDRFGGYTRTVANDVPLPVTTTVIEDPITRITSSPLGKTVRTTTVNDFGLGVTRTSDIHTSTVFDAPVTTTSVVERRGSPVRSYSTTVYDDLGAPRTYTTTFEDTPAPVTTTVTSNYGLGIARSTFVREVSPARSI
jgi:hypothetical protein